MPAIRGQTVLTDGYEIETIEFGLRRIQLEELGGNSVRLTAYLNGAQVAQTTLNNPSLTDIYTWVGANLFPGSTVSADGKVMKVDPQPDGSAALYVAWHVVQRNPLQLKLQVSNTMPPADWWQ